MKWWRSVLCLALCAQTARAETVLSFAAQIEDEALAEDAIQLVHCLSERSGHDWEFTGETHGPLWLRIRGPAGLYHKEGKDYPFTLRAGGSDDACEQLEPAAPAPAGLGSLKPEPGSPKPDRLTPSLPPMNEPGETQATSGAPGGKAWLWVAAGLALVGGILLWRARQPSFNAVNMR